MGKTVMTLDAGGTNFVFSAIRDYKFIVDPIIMPSQAHDLEKCLNTFADGFTQIMAKLDEKPVAISFAFPGPADYPNGIIGGFLANFPSFRDGVALGPFLEERFGLPVFINNDADLYAYGEAWYGALPQINEKLKAAGSNKQYKNLLAYTLGTGFGFGLVADGRLHIGDNSCVETYCLPREGHLIEASVNISGVKRFYGELSGQPDHNLEPKDVFAIAEGDMEGDMEAAKGAFARVGQAVGDAIATGVTLLDGLIVIGGGLIGARKYIFPALMEEMRSKILTFNGESLNRIQSEVFDLDDPEQFKQFVTDKIQYVKVFGTDKIVPYDPFKRIGVTTSKIGTSEATALGAYAYAINRLS